MTCVRPEHQLFQKMSLDTNDIEDVGMDQVTEAVSVEKENASKGGNSLCALFYGLASSIRFCHILKMHFFTRLFGTHPVLVIVTCFNLFLMLYF